MNELSEIVDVKKDLEEKKIRAGTERKKQLQLNNPFNLSKIKSSFHRV